MARNSRPTAAKREREKGLIERRQQKAERRRQEKERKGTTPVAPDGTDPDIADIKLGPQPATLFEPPQGFSKLPPEAVAPLLGLKLKSARQAN